MLGGGGWRRRGGQAERLSFSLESPDEEKKQQMFLLLQLRLFHSKFTVAGMGRGGHKSDLISE